LKKIINGLGFQAQLIIPSPTLTNAHNLKRVIPLYPIIGSKSVMGDYPKEEVLKE